jgi:hypothetical protein
MLCGWDPTALDRQALAAFGKRVADLVLASAREPAAARPDWIDARLAAPRGDEAAS